VGEVEREGAARPNVRFTVKPPRYADSVARPSPQRPRSLRCRRRLKWLALSVCAPIWATSMLGIMVSRWRTPSLVHVSQSSMWGLQVEWRGMTLYRFGGPSDMADGYYFQLPRPWKGVSGFPRGLPQVIHTRPGSWEVVIPHWLLALPSAAGSFFLWRSLRQGCDPHACPHCGYSRAGIDDASPCPECGGTPQ
jgi:hypothetical protein